MTGGIRVPTETGVVEVPKENGRGFEGGMKTAKDICIIVAHRGVFEVLFWNHEAGLVCFVSQP